MAETKKIDTNDITVLIKTFECPRNMVKGMTYKYKNGYFTKEKIVVSNPK